MPPSTQTNTGYLDSAVANTLNSTVEPQASSKMEYEGDEMIGLCCKTYIVIKSKTIRPSNTVIAAHRILRRSQTLKPKRLKTRTTAEYTFSSNGVSKRNVKAPISIFRRVLKTQVPGSGVNRGFRAKENTVFTYTQERHGFAYFYCKTWY